MKVCFLTSWLLANFACQSAFAQSGHSEFCKAVFTTTLNRRHLGLAFVGVVTGLTSRAQSQPVNPFGFCVFEADDIVFFSPIFQSDNANDTHDLIEFYSAKIEQSYATELKLKTCGTFSSLGDARESVLAKMNESRLYYLYRGKRIVDLSN